MARRPYFTVCKIYRGWEWNLYAANNRPIASSITSWDTKSRAKRACESVRKAMKLAKIDIEEEC